MNIKMHFRDAEVWMAKAPAISTSPLAPPPPECVIIPFPLSPAFRLNLAGYD